MSKAKDLVCEGIRVLREDQDPNLFAQVVNELCALSLEEISGFVISFLVADAAAIDRKYALAHNQLSGKNLGARIASDIAKGAVLLKDSSVEAIPEEFRQEMIEFNNWVRALVSARKS